MKRIKFTKKYKNQILNDFKNYLDKLEAGKKVEYTYKDEISIKDKPVVTLSQKAYIKIKTLVTRADGEIGWNGTVLRTDNHFYIDDIFVYPQTVTQATVTCDEMETAKWLMSLPTEVFNKLRFQAHSHVNMGISPSGVDTTLYEKYTQNLGPEDFYIFMIFNKKDDYYIEIVDNKTNIVYYKNDVEVNIENTSEFWDSIKDNIKTYQPPKPSQQTVITGATNTPSTTTDECKQTTCKDCENFQECAKKWYDKKLKELNTNGPI